MEYDYFEIDECVRKAVFNRACYYPIDKKTRALVYVLQKAFRYDSEMMDDLVTDIIMHIITPGEVSGSAPIDSFDEEKAGLQTFITWQVFGFVGNRLKSLYRKKAYDVIEISESDFGDGEDTNFLDSLEDTGLSPEDVLLQKEEFELAHEILGEEIVDIILEKKTQTELAKEEGVDRRAVHDKYKRRLRNLAKARRKQVRFDP